ncbi:MAG: PAS domain S-box protein [Sporocytophaga sp.]|nr:PAS domain S-box protein [Sporocytophaga sp.]
MEEWKEDKLPFSREGISPLDMALLEKGRKSILLKFLPLYTKNLKKALEIVNEIENFYSFQSVNAIEYFSDIQNAVILKKNQELTHAYEQLKESNEELVRTEELLKESNDNLEDIVKARTAQIVQSEERYKAFINQSSEGIWRLELNGIDGIPVNLPVDRQLELLYSFGYFAECNVRMAKMHGYEDISAVLDKKLQDIMSFANFSPYGYFNSFIESGYNLSDAESLEIDSQGRIVYILNNIQGVIENGKLVRAWGTQRDITDEKNTEERLRYVVNNAPIIIWSLDKAGNVVLAEGKTLMPEMNDRDKVDGKISLKELKYLPELSASAMRALEGEAFAKIIKIGDKSFEAHFSPLKDYTGKVTGAVNVAIDITDRITIEKKLLESEDRFRLSIEAADLGTWDITDLSGEFVWDERSKRFFGLSKNAKVNYEVFLNGIHHEDREYVKAAIDATLRNEGKDDIDVEFRTVGYEDKMLRWIRIRGKAYFKRKGEPFRFIGTSQDITNKKVQENELKSLADKLSESKYRLSLITNVVPAFISYIDPDKKYVFTNNYYKRLFPNGEKIIGKKISDIVGVESTPFFYDHFEKAVREKRNVTFDYVLNKEEAGFFNSNIRVTYIPDIDENDNVRGVVAMGLDITESIRYERDLEKKNKELSKINNDLDNFIYTASHDLKAPVTNIEGLVSSLIETLKESNCSMSDETKLVVSLIKDSVGRFQVTIKDLSEIGKIQKNFVEDVSYIDVKEIIEETELSIENKIQEADAEIELDINDCPVISFSRSNFRSVVYNLLTNALKYRSPERKSRIIIKCMTDKDYSILEFRDNGLGMKEHLKIKIFQMFKRLHDHVEGTGVGLYLVKRIIDNSGGKIEVETTEGEGSVFRIFFRNSPNILSV